MEYRLYGAEVLESPALIHHLKRQLDLYVQNLQRYFKRYNYPVTLEVHWKKEGQQWVVTLKIPLRHSEIVVKEKDWQPSSALKKAYTKLKREIKTFKAKERKEYLYKRKNRRVEKLGTLLARLQESQEDEKRFKDHLKESIAEIENYMMRRYTQEKPVQLTAAMEQEILEAFRKYVYQRFKEANITNQDQLEQWLYTQAEQFLQAHELGEEATYLMPTAQDFLSETIQEEVLEGFTEEQIQEATEKTLKDADSKDRAAFTLYTTEGLDEKTIATILKETPEQIKDRLEKLRQRFKEQLQDYET